MAGKQAAYPQEALQQEKNCRYCFLQRFWCISTTVYNLRSAVIRVNSTPERRITNKTRIVLEQHKREIELRI